MPELKNLHNYFGATPDRPYHLSVGAIVLDLKNDVICLHYPQIDHLTNIYKIPTETVKPNESLEEAVQRGCLEELGSEVSIITYIGTQVTNDVWWNELQTPKKVTKSVIFFLVKLNQQLAITVEGTDYTITSKPFNFLIDSMKSLQVKDGMRDFNQSEILINAKLWITEHPGLLSPTL